MARAGYAAVASLLLSVLTIPMAPAARADCTGTWDLAGVWWLAQSNNAFLAVDLQQSGSGLDGRAKVDDGTVGQPRRVENGKIDGNKFSFTVNWGTGSVGEYEGLIDEWGAISGVSVDRNTGARATWSGDRAATCKPSDTQLLAEQIKRVTCGNYANNALAAAKFNAKQKCGNTGSRWITHRSHHESWCLGLGKALNAQTASETRIRTDAVKLCVARSAIKYKAPGDVTTPAVEIDPGGKDVVKKPPPIILKKPRPGSDLTKPSEPVVK